MKIKNIVCVALGIAAFSLIGCFSHQEKKITKFPTHPIEQGVSAPFAGIIGNWMLIGGGCNFPDTPAAEGGKKVFYKDIFAINTSQEELQWNLNAAFTLPVAYGASVTTGQGLVCIGGINNTTLIRDVYSLGIDAQQRSITSSRLPSLPEGIDNASATNVGRKLYVTGGNQENGGNALYCLCLDTDTVWTKLPDYPGPQRIQPVLLESDDELFLFGGFTTKISTEEDGTKEEASTHTASSTKEGIISSNYIVYSIKNNTWSEPIPLPAMMDGSTRALVGSSGIRVGNHFILAGGVNYQIFKAAIEGNAPKDYMKRPAEWYQFSDELLVYNLQTKVWSHIPHVEGFNKAGGCLLHKNGALYMACGETKPGIRTNEIVKKDMKELIPLLQPIN